MDKRIENSIDSNANLSEEFKKISKACFGRIFDMLGKRNFIRWIDTRELSDRIKELVIESMTSDEEKKEPTIGGYYSRGKNKITLRLYDNKKTIEDTATHEKFHFITDKKETFNTFIDEGLTEYMKSMAEGKATAYISNVVTVKFLHKVFGDSLIKAYLLGTPYDFNKKFASLIVGENPNKMKEGLAEVNRFYNNLEKFHAYNYAKLRVSAITDQNKSEEPDEETRKLLKDLQKKEEAAKAVKDDITAMFNKIVVAKISKMASNLEFYREGKLDLKYAMETVQGLIEYMPIREFEDDFYKAEHLKYETIRLAAREIIKNSHLVAYDGPEEKENKITRLSEVIIPTIEFLGNQIIRRPAVFDNDEPLFSKENDDIIPKLLHTLTSEPNLDIITYLERLAIIQDKFGISEQSMEYILAKHNTDKFGNSPILGNINTSIIKNFPMFRRLSELEREREKDSIESLYSEIDLNRFIEKRDNQKFYIEFGENGEIYEEELKFGSNIIFRGNERIEINYKNGLRNVEITDRQGKRQSIYAPITLQELKSLKFAQIVIRKNV